MPLPFYGSYIIPPTITVYLQQLLHLFRGDNSKPLKGRHIMYNTRRKRKIPVYKEPLIYYLETPAHPRSARNCPNDKTL